MQQTIQQERGVAHYLAITFPEKFEETMVSVDRKPHYQFSMYFVDRDRGKAFQLYAQEPSITGADIPHINARNRKMAQSLADSINYRMTETLWEHFLRVIRNKWGTYSTK